MKIKENSGLWVAELFRRGGVDLARLTRKHPVEVANLMASPAHIPLWQLNYLLESCAVMSGDNSFGLHLVNAMDLSMMGIYGYLLAAAPTVERFLHFGGTYYPTLYRGAALSFSIKKARCSLQFSLDEQNADSSRHLNEWTLGFYAVCLARFSGSGWKPISAGFTNAPGDNQSDLESIFGSDISFNQPFSYLEFDTRILNFSINAANDDFLEILTDQAEKLMGELEKEHTLADDVRLQILERLERKEATAEKISHFMAMSTSTLKRRLARENQTFRKIRDEVIQQLAAKALVETQTEIGAIATKLGYSELSAFDRAFKRETGMSPSRYRESHQAEPENQVLDAQRS